MDSTVIDAALPDWVQGISLLTFLLLTVLAFLRDWVITSRRHERELALKDRVIEVWEGVANKATENNDRLVDALDPVLKGNDAVLKILGEMQEEQRNARRRNAR